MVSCTHIPFDHPERVVTGHSRPRQPPHSPNNPSTPSLDGTQQPTTLLWSSPVSYPPRAFRHAYISIYLWRYPNNLSTSHHRRPEGDFWIFFFMVVLFCLVFSVVHVPQGTWHRSCSQQTRKDMKNYTRQNNTTTMDRSSKCETGEEPESYKTRIPTCITQFLPRGYTIEYLTIV